MIELVPLEEIEASVVDALLDDAFGTDRFSRTAYKLRAGTAQIEPLSFAAIRAGELVGSIQCWPVAHVDPNGRSRSLTLVGPVAVSPVVQRAGIGRMLMTRMLEAAEARDFGVLMMIGDPEYYDRFFGFSSAFTQGWDLPGPFEARRLLAKCRDHAALWGGGTIEPDLTFASRAITA